MSERVVVDVSDLEAGRTRVVRAGDLELVVCRVDGAWYAFENRCPHQDFPLGDARLRGHVIECSLHGGRFDVRDGCPVRAPTRESLRLHAVHVRDGRVEVEIP